MQPHVQPGKLQKEEINEHLNKHKCCDIIKNNLLLNDSDLVSSKIDWADKKLEAKSIDNLFEWVDKYSFLLICDQCDAERAKTEQKIAYYCANHRILKAQI